MNIPYGHQLIDQSDIDSVVDALKSDLLTTGPYVEKFERELENWVGGAKTTAVSSGTAALHAAYFAAGIDANDEVITPPLTFIATQATAMNLGAKIKFVDIDSETGNIDPELVEAAITSKTKVVTTVDYAGQPGNLPRLRSICDKHNLILIEDAAHSLGSKYRDEYVGSIADLTTFSFFPTKNITTGEGGAVASKNEELLERARSFSRQGLVREPSRQSHPERGPWNQEVHEIGLNYRLPDILAALGISQLKKLEIFKKRRQQIFSTYCESFRNLPEIILPKKTQDTDPVWHLFPIRVPKEIRENIFVGLHSHGIKAQVNYLPSHWHPVFEKLNVIEDLPIAEEFYRQEISLPMSASLSDVELEYVIEKFIEVYNQFLNTKD
jgi:dTDP-4-amino-4,6-dideoxygalactose transaminase